MKTNQFYNVDFVVFGQFGPCLGFKCTQKNKKNQHVWKRLALWQTITHYLGRFKTIEAVEACIFGFFSGNSRKTMKINWIWEFVLGPECIHWTITCIFSFQIIFLFLFVSTIFRRKRLKPTKWNCLNMFVYDKPFDSTTTTSLQLEKHKVYRGFLGISMFPMQNQENATNCFNCQKSSKQTHENINEPIWTSPKNMILLRNHGKNLENFLGSRKHFQGIRDWWRLVFFVGFFWSNTLFGKNMENEKKVNIQLNQANQLPLLLTLSLRS